MERYAQPLGLTTAATSLRQGSLYCRHQVGLQSGRDRPHAAGGLTLPVGPAV